MFQIPLTLSLLGYVLVAADQSQLFSGVLSLILSGPCGLTCDRFHITQLQRSLGDQFLPVRGMHWFRDLSWRDTFVFGERDGWRCGRVVLMRICCCQWCISGCLLFDLRLCVFGGSGWFPPLWWCITAARTVNLLHWRCVCSPKKYIIVKLSFLNACHTCSSFVDYNLSWFCCWKLQWLVVILGAKKCNICWFQLLNWWVCRFCAAGWKKRNCDEHLSKFSLVQLNN